MPDERPARDDGKDDDKATLAERFARKLSERRDARAASSPQSITPSLAPSPAAKRPQAAVSEAAAAAPPPPKGEEETPVIPIEIQFKQLESRGFITPQTENTQTVEEFRLIKRQIMRIAFADDGGGINENGNVIMITSAGPGAGKSFVALNLAISFSLERDFYVLLVDADNRSHAVSDMLGVGQDQPGLVDILVDDKLEMKDIIRRTSIPNLSFISAGRPHLHGSELMASKQMAGCLTDITNRYPDRIIFIDAPPLLTSTEGLVLAPHVGQSVVVVEKDHTTKKALNQALDRLQGCPEISSVLYNDPHGRRSFGKFSL